MIFLGTTGRSYNPATIDIINAMSVRPTEDRSRLIDDLVVDLKGYGVWDKMDRFYMLAAHDEQAGRLDWLNPGTDTLTAVNSPNFSVDEGFQGNGSSSYLVGGVNLSAMTHYGQNDAHLGYWSLTNSSANTSIDVGVSGNLNVAFLGRDASGQAIGRPNQNSNTGVSWAVSDSLGYYAGVRRTSVATENYKNGVSAVTGSTSSVSVPAYPVTVGMGGGAYYNRRIACVHFGSELTDTEVANIYSAIGDYLTAVGAV